MTTYRRVIGSDRLPARRANKKTREVLGERSSKIPKIMTIDDGTYTLLSRKALDKMGTVLTEETGDFEKAKEKIRKAKPDVVLVAARFDRSVPDSGFKLAEMIREELPGTVVIFMSGSYRKGDDPEKERLVFDVLEKAFELGDLEKAVQSALRAPRILLFQDLPHIFTELVKGLGICSIMNDKPVKSVKEVIAVLDAQTETPDVVVTDMSLSDNGREGFKILEAVRKRFPNAKVVLVTSAYSPKHKPDELGKQIKEAGFDGIFGEGYPNQSGLADFIKSNGKKPADSKSHAA